MSEQHRPSWLSYWRSPHPLDPSWPSANPNWRRSEHAHGIGFYAPWEEVFSGFPEHCRRSAVALASAGLAVHLRSATPGMQFFTARDIEAAKAFEDVKVALADLLNAEVKTYEAEVWQVVSEDSSIFRLGGPSHHYLGPRELALIHSRRIISTVFERDRVSADVAACLKRVAQVWVANPHDEDMLARCGVPRDHVRVVPMPFFPNDPHLGLRGLKRLPGPVRFYHIGKWEPRKEHRNIIAAFLLAFVPGQCKLYLKTSTKGPKLSSGYPESPRECLARLLEDERVKARGWRYDNVNSDVVIIQQRLTEGQIFQMHRQGDVYVTLSRGEGFDMPAFDAKLSGNLMVYTPSGGPQSFASTQDVMVLGSGSVPCDPFYRWGDARYLDYDLDEAVAALSAAKLEIEREGPRADNPMKGFRAEAVGAKMRQYIEQVTGGI